MPNFVLTLFVAGDDTEARRLVSDMRITLAENMKPDQYRLDVIDVLSMPEKALEKDVFATPTLLRELPLPVMKLIGDIAQSQKVIALIQSNGGEQQTAIV